MKCLDLLLKKWVEVHDQSGDANDTFIDNAEDLDVVMPMYNLLEYSKNYSKTTGSFWNYYRKHQIMVQIKHKLFNQRFKIF